MKTMSKSTGDSGLDILLQDLDLALTFLRGPTGQHSLTALVGTMKTL